MHRHLATTLALAVIAAALIVPAPSHSATPPPGGTHQMPGVPGTFGTWVFNGKFRVKVTAVDPRAIKKAS